MNSRRNVNHHRFQWMLAGVLVIGSAGCIETRVVRSTWDDFAKRTGAKVGGQPSKNDRRRIDPTNGRGWSIRLKGFQGPHRYAQATNLIKRLSREANLARLWIEDRDKTAYVYYGRFRNHDDEEAHFVLADIRRIELEGQLPFAHAALIPLTANNRGYDDPFNLRQYYDRFSLQIGYYDEKFAGDFRDAAEAKVRALRDQGEQAYFLHGPHRSHVTIGLYTYDQAFVTVDNPLAPGSTIDRYTPTIKQLQKKYPHNVSNGLTLMQVVGDKSVGTQKSALIRVPG